MQGEETVNFHIIGRGGNSVIRASVPNWEGTIYTLPISKIEYIEGKVESGVYIVIEKEDKVRVGWNIEWLTNDSLINKLRTNDKNTTTQQIIILTSTDETFMQPKTIIRLAQRIKEKIQVADNRYVTQKDTDKEVEVESDINGQVEIYLTKVDYILSTQGQTILGGTDNESENTKCVQEKYEQLNNYAPRNKETDKKELMQKDTGNKEVYTEVREVTVEYLIDNYDSEIYLYGDILKLNTKDVSAEGILYKGKFTLLKGTVIKNKKNNTSDIDPLTGKLLYEVDFETIDEAGKYLIQHKYTGIDMWKNIRGKSLNEMVVFEVPMGSKKAYHRNIKGKINATGYVMPGNKFLLLEGSRVARSLNKTSSNYRLIERMEYIKRNSHRFKAGTRVTNSHIIFNTITAASNFTTLKLQNGWEVWVDENGNYIERINTRQTD